MAGRSRLKYYISTKRGQCRGNRVEWKLSPDEVRQLLDEAGITEYDIGKGKGKYQLARYNDSGSYEIGNCRFITQLENLGEMKRRGPVGYSLQIFGTNYDSIKHASKELSICTGTVRNRCMSDRPKWDDWQITTEWRYDNGRT